MDLNDMRALLTVLGFIAFIAIVVWAFSKRAKKGFREASELPFADEEEAKRSGEQGKKK
jgi:cytochrome c oxidase cbb3-type subunit 4